MSGGGTLDFMRCFKCEESGHHDAECKSVDLKCFKCWRTGHRISKCRVIARLALIVESMATSVLLDRNLMRLSLEGKFLCYLE